MHKEYMNESGNHIPSVTQVLSIIDKPGLANWANGIGKQGVDLSSYLNKKAEYGTYVHECLQSVIEGKSCKLLGKYKKVDETVKLFKKLVNVYNIHDARCEVSHQTNEYGGTYDMVATMNFDDKETKVLADFKTTNQIYPEFFIQLSAYLNLIRINEPELYEEIEYCMIINVAEDRIRIKSISKETAESKFLPIFLKMLDLYNDYKEMNDQFSHIENFLFE